MPFYDGILTSYQFGDDLEVGTPSTVQPPTGDVPGANISPARPTQGGPEACICLHQGSLFAAFVEARWDGVTTFNSDATPSVTDKLFLAYGPYVKQYDPGGNTWDLVGDPIEPTLLPAIPNPFLVSAGYTTHPDGVHHDGSRNFAFGTRFYPTRVFLASDGTSLYLAYTLHQTVADAKGHKFSPFTLIVVRWDGSSWEPYGQIDPVGQQDDQSTLPPASSKGGAWGGISLAASPLDPGACYVTLVQGGLDVGVATFAYPGHYLYEGVAARFDGSSLAGDVRVIGTPWVGPGDYTFNTDPTIFQSLEIVYDDSDGPWIFWYGSLDDSIAAPHQQLYMQRWSDMAIVNVVGGGSGPSLQYPIVKEPRAYEGGAYLVDAQDGPSISRKLRDLNADGSSSAANPLDGVTPETPLPAAVLGNELHPEPPNNIWALDQQGQVWLFHRPCRGWTNIKFVARGCSQPVISGWPFSEVADTQAGGGGIFSVLSPDEYVDFLVEDGVLYVVAWLVNFRVVPAQHVLRVYAAPILRNEFECAALSIHFWDRFTVVP